MPNKIINTFVILGFTALSNVTNAGVFTLDFDSPATGSNIISDGLVNTPLGTIDLFEETSGDACIACFGTFPGDLPFATFGNGLVEAGSTGSIGLDFNFDVTELTFNFGGDGGGFEAFALDISGSILDSLIIPNLPGSGAAPGPITFTAVGIRALRFEDPVGGAAIDNLLITSDQVSNIPEPALIWLFGSGLIGLIGMRKKSA